MGDVLVTVVCVAVLVATALVVVMAADEGKGDVAGVMAATGCTLALFVGRFTGYADTRDGIEEAGYVLDYDDAGRPRIGIAPTAQPTIVRWLPTPAPTTDAGGAREGGGGEVERG